MYSTSIPHKIAHLRFWHEVTKYCSTSGTIMLKTDFSNFFAVFKFNSDTVDPKPLGYCSVAMMGICNKFAASIYKITADTFLRISWIKWLGVIIYQFKFMNCNWNFSKRLIVNIINIALLDDENYGFFLLHIE